MFTLVPSSSPSARMSPGRHTRSRPGCAQAAPGTSPQLPATGAGVVLSPCPQILHARCMQMAASGGRHQEGTQKVPLIFGCPELSPQRGVAAAWGINSSSRTAANVQVFRGLADSYFGKLWRWRVQRLSPFGPGITAGGTTFQKESRAANGEC